MNGSGHEFDLAVFKVSRRERVARHLFDNRPICEKIFLGQRLRRQLGLQNAALPRIPVRDLKGYRLRPLDDLLFGGPRSYPHRYSFVNVRLGQAVGIGIDRRALFHFLAIANERRAAGGQLGPIVLGLWGAFRPVIRDWLRVADRLGQHQAQLILRHRWLPRGR
jgi:hypothetical protein